MPHNAAFYDWKARVDTRFDVLKPHHRAALAQYSFGMILARCCGLTAVLTHLVAFLALKAHALRQRLRELYQPASAQIGTARSEFDYTLCFGPLVECRLHLCKPRGGKGIGQMGLVGEDGAE